MVRKEVGQEGNILKDAALGSSICPAIAIPVIGGLTVRPQSLTVFNLDETANLYDIRIHLVEWAPAPDGIWSRIIHEQTLSARYIPPMSAADLKPFTVMSQQKTADFQVDVTTRSGVCNGRLDLRDEGNDMWRNEASPMYRNGKLQFDGGEHKLGGHAVQWNKARK